MAEMESLVPTSNVGRWRLVVHSWLVVVRMLCVPTVGTLACAQPPAVAVADVCVATADGDLYHIVCVCVAT